MTITISGTTGIAGVDGTAATPSVQGADTNTGVFFPAVDTVGISTGGVEQVRINSAGLTLNGSTSGTLTIAAPAVSGTSTQTLVAATGTLAPLIRGTINAGGTSPFPAVSGPTQVNYTDIPSWVKRITVMLSGVSGSGTSQFLIQVGSGSIQATGYVSSASAGAGAVTQTTGFAITQTVTAATTQSGIISIVNFNSNTWVMSSNLSFSNASTTNVGGGTVTLSGVLDRLRLTTVNGTDTFDAGSINIMYE